MNVFLQQKLKSLKNHGHTINIDTSTDVFTGVGFLHACMHGLLYNSVTVKYCLSLFHIVQVSHFLFLPSPRINYPVAELDSTHTILLTQLSLHILYFHILYE